ncbi:MAG: YafY family transcriptional regulator [Acidimicrobiia bacterium]|nr:YafY family transcriptional regulator [Acidimicrobiia bacterium]
MVDTTSRMLRLLSLLQTHRFWNGVELAERLLVSRRTLRRDIDRLRTLGYVVHARRGAVGGYQLEAGSSLPPLLLDDEEAVAIAVGLRSATVGTLTGIEEISLRALAKLEQVLPSRLRVKINALSTYTVPMAGSGPQVDATTLAVLAQACRDQERVRFAYRSREGVESDRRVEPYRLVSAGRRWYLVAWDLVREDWRTFRVDRLRDLVATAWRFDARVLPADDAADFVAQAIAAAPARYDVAVTLHASVDEAAHRMQYVAEGQLEALDNGRCRFRTKGDSLEWLAASILLIGVDFEVHQPVELIDHIRDISGRLAASVPP